MSTEIGSWMHTTALIKGRVRKETLLHCAEIHAYWTGKHSISLHETREQPANIFNTFVYHLLYLTQTNDAMCPSTLVWQMKVNIFTATEATQWPDVVFDFFFDRSMIIKLRSAWGCPCMHDHFFSRRMVSDRITLKASCTYNDWWLHNEVSPYTGGLEVAYIPLTYYTDKTSDFPAN